MSGLRTELTGRHLIYSVVASKTVRGDTESNKLKQISDLHHVNTTCQFLVDMQKHEVDELRLSRGCAEVSLDPL